MSPGRWLRGPVPDVPEALQPVAHALLQAREEIEAAAGRLTEAQLRARPGGVASVAYHVYHLAGSTDRLLATALDLPLSEEQRRHLEREGAHDVPGAMDGLLVDLHRSFEGALDTLRRSDPGRLDEAREVGRVRLPSTVRGILYHMGEHAARHAGQVVTTATILESGAVS
ncbi:MAG: DinB family protein [Gemmatimonadota bacterium]